MSSIVAATCILLLAIIACVGLLFVLSTVIHRVLTDLSAFLFVVMMGGLALLAGSVVHVISDVVTERIGDLDALMIDAAVIATWVAAWRPIVWAVTTAAGMVDFIVRRNGPIRQWQDALPKALTGHIVEYRLTRVPISEVLRTGAENPPQYRWFRRYEKYAGIRFNTGGLGAPDERMRWMLPLFKPLSRNDPQRMREIAVLVTTTRPDGSSWLPSRDKGGLDAAIRQTGHPLDVGGWEMAYEVAVAEGWMSTHDYPDDLVRTWPDTLEAPAWLMPLAGIAPTDEIPAEADREGLLVLAALRGHVIDLPSLEVLTA